MELSERHTQFTGLGVSVAAISYDSSETNATFSQKYRIPYPLLSDENRVHVVAFGILNETYAEGHRAYGVPHPGIFIVDGEGIIQAKFAEKDYRQRPSFQLILESVSEMVNKPR